MTPALDAPIDSAGRVVLPRAVRESLGLRAGMRLRMRVLAGRLELTVAEDEPPAALSASGRRVLPKAAADAGFSGASEARAAVRAERDALPRRRR